MKSRFDFKQDGMTLVFRVRPWFEGVAVAISVFMGGAALAIISHKPLTALWALPLALVLFGLFGWLGLKAWCTSWVTAEGIRVKGFRSERVFSPGDVDSLRVLRASKIFSNQVSLHLRGHPPVLLFRYVAFGRLPLDQSRALAATFGVPFIDPEGEKMAGSRLAPLRWRARGDEWAYLLCISTPAIALLVIGVLVSL